MILQEDEEWLAHYGVKGMKWGVRKDRRASNRQARSDARRERLASGKGTLKDKLIRGLDVDRPKDHARVATESDKAAYKALLILGAGATVYLLSKHGKKRAPKIKENPAAELLIDPMGRPFLRETKSLLKDFKY